MESMDAILHDFEIEQRRVLLMAVDKAIDKAMKQQSDMLDTIKSRVAASHRREMDELQRQQPSLLDALVERTLAAAPSSGLVSWLRDATAQAQAIGCVTRLRSHLEARQGNHFRSDFETLLVLYMDFLRIPMVSGQRLNNRIDDFTNALQQQAATTDELSTLIYRVRWACYGVRTIGNARSHDATPLSEAEMLELCGCFSALGAAMPTLAQVFDVAPPDPAPAPLALSQGDALLMPGSPESLMDLFAGNHQLRQLAGQGGTGSYDFERMFQILAAASLNTGSSNNSSSSSVNPSPPITTNSTFTNPPLPPGYAASPRPPQPSAASHPPLPPGFPTDTSRGRMTPGGSQGNGSPTTHVSPMPLRQLLRPTVSALGRVSSYKFYHERPTELPKESDRTRMAMFARMINHMKTVPKATLCAFADCQDPRCPRAHSYLEVMSYNPPFKRLICRQPSHYYLREVIEEESCVCIHVDTGLKWDWLDDPRDKRSYCVRGSKCTNNKCFKSHSFEEMCWYNPSYKTKKCAVRAHDHIARGRGTIEPPLDCGFYHIEEGKNADMRHLMDENDHVGKPIQMLFPERTHKELADALDALRFAREHNHQ